MKFTPFFLDYSFCREYWWLLACCQSKTCFTWVPKMLVKSSHGVSKNFFTRYFGSPELQLLVSHWQKTCVSVWKINYTLDNNCCWFTKKNFNRDENISHSKFGSDKFLQTEFSNYVNEMSSFEFERNLKLIRQYKKCSSGAIQNNTWHSRSILSKTFFLIHFSLQCLEALEKGYLKN